VRDIIANNARREVFLTPLEVVEVMMPMLFIPRR